MPTISREYQAGFDAAMDIVKKLAEEESDRAYEWFKMYDREHDEMFNKISMEHYQKHAILMKVLETAYPEC